MNPVAAGGVVACCDCGASVTGDADQTRHSADCATYTTTDVINVTWRNGAYYVDRPNWCGGKVVLAIDYAIARQALTAAQAEADRLRVDAASKQARIDALMLEYCPEEMTEEQTSECARHQAPVRFDEADRYRQALEQICKVSPARPKFAGVYHAQCVAIARAALTAIHAAKTEQERGE